MIDYDDIDGSFEKVNEALKSVNTQDSYKENSLRDQIITTMNEHFYQEKVLPLDSASFEQCLGTMADPASITQQADHLPAMKN